MRGSALTCYQPVLSTISAISAKSMAGAAPYRPVTRSRICSVKKPLAAAACPRAYEIDRPPLILVHGKELEPQARHALKRATGIFSDLDDPGTIEIPGVLESDDDTDHGSLPPDSRDGRPRGDEATPRLAEARRLRTAALLASQLPRPGELGHQVRSPAAGLPTTGLTSDQTMLNPMRLLKTGVKTDAGPGPVQVRGGTLAIRGCPPVSLAWLSSGLRSRRAPCRRGSKGVCPARSSGALRAFSVAGGKGRN